jgi:hypothetical protein
MEAKIIRLAPKRKQTVLSRHLQGRYESRPNEDGIIGRMQSESAVRSFVRWQSRKHPLSDTENDIWDQIEDIAVLVPNMAGSVNELDSFIHAVKSVLCMKNDMRMAKAQGAIGTCIIEISSFKNVIRLKMLGRDKTRIISARLYRNGARIIEDRESAMR